MRRLASKVKKQRTCIISALADSALRLQNVFVLQINGVREPVCPRTTCFTCIEHHDRRSTIRRRITTRLGARFRRISCALSLCIISFFIIPFSRGDRCALIISWHFNTHIYVYTIRSSLYVGLIIYEVLILGATAAISR